MKRRGVTLVPDRAGRELIRNRRCRCCQSVVPTNSARAFRSPAVVLKKQRVAELLHSGPLRVLEVGGGCLRNARYLQRLGHHVTVVEVPGIEIIYPRQYSAFRVAGGLLHFSLSAVSNKFDLVVMTFVIETVCDRLRRRGLLRAAQVRLRRGGHLVISARGPKDLLTAAGRGKRCGDGFLTPNRTFARSYTPAQIRSMLFASGFSQVELLHRLPIQQPEIVHAIARRG